MRTREVWIHAVDLDNGGSFYDIPADVIDRLLVDVTRSWRLRDQGLDLLLKPTDRAQHITVGTSPNVELAGAAADLARWATGRGKHGITSSIGHVPEPPRWL
jgi:maleylpyruvate isomerase